MPHHPGDWLPLISFRHLRVFTAIGDLNSVRRAAEECGLSQPAVTQALSKLEEQVGVSLVDRRACGSYLNEFGTILHGRVRRFHEQMERTVIDFGAAQSPTPARAAVNRMSRAQVRTFLGLVEYGSFERASAASGLSVSSLQRAARELESGLKLSLFYRTADGLLVSPQGLQFGRRLRLALQELGLGLDEIEEARGGGGRPITIGAMPFGGSVLLASVLDDFLALHPRADIRIINDSAPEMKRALMEGGVDLVVGLLPDRIEAELVGLPFAPTPYSVAVRRGHPLTYRGMVTTADMAAYDWVIGTPGSSRRACFERLFEGVGRPKAPIATCALTVLQHLVRRSDRLTLMTSYELEHGDDALRALSYGPILPVPSLGVMTRANWLPTRVHADLIEIVRSRVQDPAPPLRAVS